MCVWKCGLTQQTLEPFTERQSQATGEQDALPRRRTGSALWTHGPGAVCPSACVCSSRSVSVHGSWIGRQARVFICRYACHYISRGLLALQHVQSKYSLLPPTTVGTPHAEAQCAVCAPPSEWFLNLGPLGLSVSWSMQPERGLIVILSIFVLSYSILELVFLHFTLVIP